MNKNTVIIGDSYSTFKDFVPNGYAIYYPDVENTKVCKVEQTWWHSLAKECNLNVVLNNSWSGSTISYTGYGGSDCSTSSSFIYRLNNLIKENFFEKNNVNTVFVFGGTNDSWANSPLGELNQKDITEKDLYCVLPAINYFFKTLRSALPNANIYCLANTELKAEIYTAFEIACKEYNITKITFEKIEKICGHPTPKGMAEIKETVKKHI